MGEGRGEGGARVDAAFTIPAGHPAFEGHFPGRPIVPAVILLAEVLAAVEAASSLAPQAWTVANAKFLAPVAPDTPLVLVVEEAAAGARRFEIRGPEGLVASGSLARSAD